MGKNAPIRSYADCVELMQTCRSKANGKPLRRWARMYQEKQGYQDVFVIRLHNNAEIAHITPDNVLEFVMSHGTLRNYSNTIVQMLHKDLPCGIIRIATGRYRIGWTGKAGPRVNYGTWKQIRTEAPEYFAGLRFNLTTGECINALPDFQRRVIPEKRSDWLRSLSAFKKGIRVRAKLGVFDTLSDQYTKDHGHLNRWQRPSPDWSDETTFNLLVDAIRNSDFPMELMSLLVQHSYRVSNTWNAPKIDGKKVQQDVWSLLSSRSVELREAFGVFNGPTAPHEIRAA